MTLTVGKHVVSTSLRNDLELILIFLQEESAKELMVMVTEMATALSGPTLLHMLNCKINGTVHIFIGPRCHFCHNYHQNYHNYHHNYHCNHHHHHRNFFWLYVQNVVFYVRKRRTKLPELGRWGVGDSGNGRK